MSVPIIKRRKSLSVYSSYATIKQIKLQKKTYELVKAL